MSIEDEGSTPSTSTDGITLIEKKSVPDLTPVEWRACYSANYGAGGYMRNTLLDNKNNSQAFVLMVWNGPHDTPKNLQAWCLVTPVSLRGYSAGTRYTKTRSKYTAQFWVKRPYRKRGIGAILMSEVKKYDPRPHCFPHDEKSGGFFAGYDVTAAGDERHWMKKVSDV